MAHEPKGDQPPHAEEVAELATGEHRDREAPERGPRNPTRLRPGQIEPAGQRVHDLRAHAEAHGGSDPGHATCPKQLRGLFRGNHADPAKMVRGCSYRPQTAADRNITSSRACFSISR